MSHSHGPRPLSTGSRSSLLERKETEGASTPTHPFINSRKAQQRRISRLLWIRKSSKCPATCSSSFELEVPITTSPLGGRFVSYSLNIVFSDQVEWLPCLPVNHTQTILSRLKVCLPAGEGRSSCERMDSQPAKLTSTIIGEFCLNCLWSYLELVCVF